jgi:formyl-CoA transferase
MLDFQAARWLIAREVPPQAGNDHPTSIPTGVFRTRDGHINIASAGDEIFGRLCRALDAPELAEHPDYRTGRLRSDNRKALNAAIEAVTETRDSAEWIERFNKAGVPAGPIYTMDQVFADPQVKHLGIAQAVDHASLGRLELVGQAVTLSRTPSRLRTASPEPGEHSAAILRELGYSDGDIAGLRDRRII